MSVPQMLCCSSCRVGTEWKRRCPRQASWPHLKAREILSHYTVNHPTSQSHTTSSVRREKQDNSRKGDLLQPFVAQISNWFVNCDSVTTTSTVANHIIYGIQYNIEIMCRRNVRTSSMGTFNVIGQCRCHLKHRNKQSDSTDKILKKILKLIFPVSCILGKNELAINQKVAILSS